MEILSSALILGEMRDQGDYLRLPTDRHAYSEEESRIPGDMSAACGLTPFLAMPRPGRTIISMLSL
jgi:hypothetical protein